MPMKTIAPSTVTVQPTSEPISCIEVKDASYVVCDDSYDSQISNLYIPAARRYVEKLANRSLITQTRKQYHDHLASEFFVRFSPVQSITSITYKDSNEVTQTLTSTLYTLDKESIPARIAQAYDATYPSGICDTNAVTITAVCGYGAADAVPVIYKMAMLKLCTHWLHNRGICMDDETQEIVSNIIAIEGATVEYA